MKENERSDDAPEPAGFAAEIDRIGLEILGARPLDDTWLQVRLRLRNGTHHAFTPRQLALWSRNVGWYGWKDGMADSAVRFEPESADHTIDPGESADLVLSILRECARQGSRGPARKIRIDFSYVDAARKGHEISSNVLEIRRSPGPARPTVPRGEGCLSALFPWWRR